MSTSTAPEVKKFTEIKKGLYWLIILGVIGVIAILSLILIIPLWGYSLDIFGIKIGPVQVLTLLGGLWIVESVVVVKVNEYLGVTLFGRPVAINGPGIYFVPKGLFHLYRVRSDIMEEFWPDHPNKVFHGEDKDTLPDGNSRAWRFLSGAPKDGGGTNAPIKRKDVDFSNILEVQQTIEISGFVAWRVNMNALFDYIIASGNNREEVRLQILAIIRGNLTVEASKYTVAELMPQLDAIALNLQEKIQKVVGDTYGIDIKTLKIDPPNISRDLAAAQRDANKARAEAVATKTKADAEEYRLTKEGAGKANAIQAEIESVGKGVTEAARTMGMSPATVYAGRIAENTIGQSSVTVLGTETFSNVVGGIGASVLTGLNKNTPTTEKKDGGE
jgi:regulator of protease activity HflC (stomatin/prohibitin superfamily)